MQSGCQKDTRQHICSKVKWGRSYAGFRTLKPRQYGQAPAAVYVGETGSSAVVEAAFVGEHLVLPGARLFVAFEIADVLVFLTRFSWFSELSGYGGLPIGAFEIAVVIRAIILALCLATWLRRKEVVPEPVELEDPLATSGAAAPAPA